MDQFSSEGIKPALVTNWDWVYLRAGADILHIFNCFFLILGEQVEDFSRVCEENKRLLSQLEEKDKRIHLLEIKVNQVIFQFTKLWSILILLIHFDPFWSILIYFDSFWSILINFDPFWSILILFDLFQLMKDTRTIAEESARYQKENSTLVKALSTITSKDTPAGPSSSKKT